MTINTLKGNRELSDPYSQYEAKLLEFAASQSELEAEAFRGKSEIDSEYRRVENAETEAQYFLERTVVHINKEFKNDKSFKKAKVSTDSLSFEEAKAKAYELDERYSKASRETVELTELDKQLKEARALPLKLTFLFAVIIVAVAGILFLIVNIAAESTTEIPSWISWMVVEHTYE